MAKTATMHENFSILVVDDFPPFLDTLAEVLDARVFEVETANSWSEALEILQDHQEDILLMEVNMPDMNGVQLYQEARKIQPGLTAILMTAYAADDMIKQAMAEGITTILDKSLDIGFLIVLFSAIQKIKLHSQ